MLRTEQDLVAEYETRVRHAAEVERRLDGFVRGQCLPIVRPQTGRSVVVGRVLAAAAVVALVAVGAGWLHERTGPHRSDTGGRTVYDRLIVRDGDEVQVSGTVFVGGGQPARICDDTAPYNQPLLGPSRAYACRVGLRVVGLDLSEVQDRRQRPVRGQDGRQEPDLITGRTTVRGIYRHGRIDVQGQLPARDNSVRPMPTVPCLPPAGGWKSPGPFFVNTLDDFVRTHPDLVVQTGFASPGGRSGAFVVLVHGDPDPVRRALSAAYPRALCVLRTSYSARQVQRARQPFRVAERNNTYAQPDLSPVQHVYGTPTRTGRPAIIVRATRVTPALARLAGRQPSGLVHLRPWLAPAP